jgi:uncharacterized protein with HEPN domain
MNDRDRTRLQHMLEAAVEATAFIKDRVLQDLAKNRILLLALVKEIEIIGEAASQISEEFRAKSPEIPWAKIKGMRNRLIHAYSEVKLARRQRLRDHASCYRGRRRTMVLQRRSSFN